MGKKDAKKPAGNIIAVNRRARHDYFIEDSFEAGLSLEGWEVKSLRGGNAQLTEAYVHVKKNEAWLVGAHFAPLKTVSTHIHADPTRTSFASPRIPCRSERCPAYHALTSPPLDRR